MDPRYQNSKLTESLTELAVTESEVGTEVNASELDIHARSA